MKDLKKWQILQSELIVNSPWCRVRQDRVRLPNGEIVDDFFVNIRPDIALILPVTPQAEIVFVRQYRHGIGEILLELPAGTFNPAVETGEFAALRELTEETGYVAEEIIFLAKLYDNPVKDTNSVHLFLAKNVKFSGSRNLDITEDIDVVLVPIKEVMGKIERGEICVAGSLSAIFLGLNFLNREKML